MESALKQRTSAKSVIVQHLSKLEWRKWAGFSAMCVGMFMAILDIQIVATSITVIQEAFAISPTRLSWLQTAYLIAEVIAIPVTGYLTRAFSLRILFSIALSVFVAASIGCALSNTYSLLLFWRVIQGLAGGCLIPLVFSAVFLLFKDKEIPIATTMAGCCAVLAPSLGPVIGGYVTQTYSWHWLFLINVVPGLAAFFIAKSYIPRTNPQFGLLARIDWIALGALAISLASLEIALKEAPKEGWYSAIPVALLTLALTAGALFVHRSLTVTSPVVNFRLFRERNFSIACALSFVLGIGLYSSVYLMPVFLGFVRNHGALDIGHVMLVTGVVQLIVAPFAVQLDMKMNARLMTGLGFVFFAIGLGLSAFQTRLTDYDEMFWPQVVRGAAIMLCLLPPTRIALQYLKTDQVPDGSALFNLMRNLGGAIGIAIIDTLIWQRVTTHSQALATKLMAGDARAADAVGVSLETIFAAGEPPNITTLQPLIEKAALVTAINEAWAVISIITCAAIILLPFVRDKEPKSG